MTSWLRHLIGLRPRPAAELPALLDGTDPTDPDRHTLLMAGGIGLTENWLRERGYRIVHWAGCPLVLYIAPVDYADVCAAPVQIGQTMVYDGERITVDVDD